MPNLITPANLVESNIKTYLDSLSSITYPVFEGLGVTDLSTPCIIVVAGNLSEFQPSTGLFRGEIGFQIESQIDDVSHVRETHDQEVNAVYEALEDFEALAEVFNDNGTLKAFYNKEQNQGREEKERTIWSTYTYMIDFHRLSLPA